MCSPISHFYFPTHTLASLLFHPLSLLSVRDAARSGHYGGLMFVADLAYAGSTSDILRRRLTSPGCTTRPSFLIGEFNIPPFPPPLHYITWMDRAKLPLKPSARGHDDKSSSKQSLAAADLHM
uniref:Uncharacterized protein LOC105049633 n=1 Tax=Elaeis guineensis var. tenera TaxID=51953 RepID=A0A8N4EZD3_ELAGV|nr:uncharacterized protein LOC105049633 [Elaeis guineensis]